MNLSEEQLSVIRDMAAHFMPPVEIAFMLGVSADDFRCWLQDDNHPAFRAYNEAKIASVLELRRKIVGMAKKGSPQAEMLVNQFIQDQILGED